MFVRLVFALAAIASAGLVPGFRPPAVPLVVIDPYISVWSFSDHLYDSWATHWSGSVMALTGLIYIDGKGYRFLGPAGIVNSPPNLNQTNVQVFPTKTIYDFEGAGVHLTVTFTTPSYFGDQAAWSTYSDPITYISYAVSTTDANPHKVQIYYDNTGEVIANNDNTSIVWEANTAVKGQTVLRIGAANQNPVSSSGDGVKVSWGWWYVSADATSGGLKYTMAGADSARGAFLSGQPLPAVDNRQPRAVNDNWPVLAFTWDLGTITSGQTQNRHLTIAFDDIYSIKYYGDNLEPFWKISKGSVETLLQIYTSSYDAVVNNSNTFDNNLITTLTNAGGDKYATISSLVYRQVTGGTKQTWNDRTSQPWNFMKEISSCGCLQTVDVIYPASPFFLYFSPEALRQQLVPHLAYANNETAIYGDYVPYNLAWAPHHLGQYPIANIRPDQQEQMPMEETGNFFLMLAAVAQKQNDVSYLNQYWTLLDSWSQYLNDSLPDPEDQLCTDDFEGPSPHNVNLAAKGIVGLGAYSVLLRLKGDSSKADAVLNQAKVFVQDWLTMANDNDHYRLQYDEPNTWSLKYNLLFQKVLGLDLFPQSVFDKELAYYLSAHLNPYGVPLDNRNTFTKSDWEMWVAALGSQDQFNTLVNALYQFAHTTPSRVPFTDWYDTIKDTKNGFQARPVMGGLYSRLLFTK